MAEWRNGGRPPVRERVAIDKHRFLGLALKIKPINNRRAQGFEAMRAGDRGGSPAAPLERRRGLFDWSPVQP
jgi:hypothetical protein